MNNNIKDKLIELRNKLVSINNNSAKKVANTISQYINKHLDEIITYSDYYIDGLEYYLGRITAYYIKTRDSNTNYSVEEIIQKNPEWYGKISYNQIYENSITNGFFTHSSNGYTAKMIEKNGLGSKLNRDEELSKDLDYLEKNIGESPYLKAQTNDATEVYFTAPGTTTYSYALNFSPERLFLGILKQERENSLPVIVGESEIEYYKRVISNKIQGDSNYQQIMIVAERVFNKLFKYNSTIFLFPIYDKTYSIKASESIYKEETAKNISDIIKENITEDANFFFTEQPGSNSNTNNMDNLVMINTVIPFEKMGKIEIPTRYKLLQRMAILKGMHPGDTFDYFTGEKIEKGLSK